MADDGIWTALAAASTVPPGEVVGVEHLGRKIALYNLDGVFYATDNVCTHAFALLSEGWIEGQCIRCPLHGGRFDIATGRAQRVPVTEDIATYPVRVEAGRLEVLLPAGALS